jgi:hypothetical protein
VVSGQLHVTAALPSGREPPVSIRWKARVGPDDVEKRKILLDSDPSAIHPVVSRCTDFALSAPYVRSVTKYY